MGFVIPSSRKKFHLSGADWVINVLDHILKSETCSGNSSQVVIELDGMPDREQLKDRLQSFISKFPVLHGSISRDYNLAPYWKIPSEKNFPLVFDCYEDKNMSDSDVSSLLTKAVNRKFLNENSHLAFHLIKAGQEKSCFAMTFDHRLFDGRGAEMFLDLFEQFVSGKDSTDAGVFDYRTPAHLDNWMKKFNSGRNVNRKMVEISGRSTAALPVPQKKNKAFRFRTIHFSIEETGKIHEDAFRRAGYLMETPYLLSLINSAFTDLFRSKGLTAEATVVPVSVDMRQNDNSRRELFLNHVSYLFYQVPVNISQDMQEAIRTIRNQMYDQIKSGLPKDIMEASLLTRIASPRLLKKIFSIPVEGKIASYCFSHIGKSSYNSSEFMGSDIKNIFHMPRVPVPPGLGFFFNNYRDRLNLVISYLEGLIEESELDDLEHRIKESLRS